MMRKYVFSLLIIIFALTLYLLAWPVPIHPVAWSPPPAPQLSGMYAQNSELSRIERLPVDGFGPEDVAIDDQERIYCGTDDGRIFSLQPDGTHPQIFANTHGRPLGLKFDRNGNLIVADANKGLLSIDRQGIIETLSTQADGLPFRCTNDLDIADDGTIYFTDSSYKFSLADLKADLLEHQPNGRLLAFDPNTRQTRVILRNLYFSNGVAVSPDQSFVLVSETAAYRVRRVWIKGLKAGEADIFMDDLPGFPDGIASNGRDTFWLALVNRRNSALDGMMPYPSLRKIVMRLPNFLQPKIERYAFVLGIDTKGHVSSNLQDASPECFARISNVIEHHGMLYFGSIGERAIGRFRFTLE
jgi:sugar lactone lactonase YvrE